MNATNNFNTSNFTDVDSEGRTPLLFSLCITSINVIAFVCMLKCKGIAENIKVMTMNLLISDIVYGMSFSFRVFVIFDDVFDDKTQHNACYFQEAITFGSNIAAMLTITYMASDRCVCLYHEMSYMAYVTARKVILYQISIWILAFLVTLTVALDYKSVYVTCLPGNIMGIYGLCIQLTFGIGCRVISGVAYFFVYKKILKIRQADILAKTSSRKMYYTTYKLLMIGLTWNVMYVPFFCYTVYIMLYGETKKTIFLYFANGLVITNSVVNPFIYVWRFPECRLQLQLIFCFFNKKRMANAVEQRKRILVSFLEPR